jgi:hypothetical protein
MTEEKNKGGRPPKGELKRSEIMCIAWTKEEKAYLITESRKLGIKWQEVVRNALIEYKNQI